MRDCRPHSVAVLVTMLACSILLGGCASAATYSAEPGEPVEITLDTADKKARVDLEDRQYRLTLEQIVDSRCPNNAKCIWAGELAARIQIERIDQGVASREITLGESTMPSTEALGAKLELVTISETSVTLSMRTSEGR